MHTIISLVLLCYYHRQNYSYSIVISMLFLLLCYNSFTIHYITADHICDLIWEKGALRAKRDFLSLFNLPPFQSSESLGLQTWFVSSLDLLLHRSNVRTLSKPPVPSGEPPKRGIKRRFSGADPEPPIRGVLIWIFVRKILTTPPFHETTPT